MPENYPWGVSWRDFVEPPDPSAWRCPDCGAVYDRIDLDDPTPPLDLYHWLCTSCLTAHEFEATEAEPVEGP